MTISVRARDLTKGIEKLESAQSTAGAAKAIQTRIDSLEDRKVRLEPAANFLIALSEQLGSDPEPIGTSATSSKLKELRLAIENRVDALTEGDLFKEAVGALDKLIEVVEVAARAQWSRYAEECGSPVNDDVIHALRSVPGFLETTTRIRRLALSITSKANRDWVEPEELATFAADCAELKEAWEELEAGKAIPTEVVAFLQKTARSGARLADLSETVLTWIGKQDLMDEFRIVAADDD